MEISVNLNPEHPPIIPSDSNSMINSVSDESVSAALKESLSIQAEMIRIESIH